MQSNFEVLLLMGSLTLFKGLAGVDDFVQPVGPGTNWLFCSPFYGAVKYGKTTLITEVGWKKWKTDGSWDWLGGIDRTENKTFWKSKLPEGHGSRYRLTTDGFLELNNVTKEDHNTEYRCTIVGYFDNYREDFHIKLNFREPEVKEAQNCTCPETSNNCTCSAANETTTDKSATDGKCTPWIIVCVLLLFCLIVSLLVLWEKISPYRCTCQRNAIRNPQIADELRNEISTSNGNVNNDQGCSNNHDSKELDLPYGLHESNGNNENYITESVD